jgi:hypothetical protein
MKMAAIASEKSGLPDSTPAGECGPVGVFTFHTTRLPSDTSSQESAAGVPGCPAPLRVMA